MLTILWFIAVALLSSAVLGLLLGRVVGFDSQPGEPRRESDRAA